MCGSWLSSYWLLNGSHKMYSIQSPCKNGNWENCFCRALAELLNYLSNWKGGKNHLIGIKKVFMDQCKNISQEKIRFFFPLGRWKEKKVYFSVCEPFHSVLLIMQLFFIPTSFGLVFVAIWKCLMPLASEISLLPALSQVNFFSMIFMYVLHCFVLVRCYEVCKDSKFLSICNSQIKYGVPQNLQLQI